MNTRREVGKRSLGEVLPLSHGAWLNVKTHIERVRLLKKGGPMATLAHGSEGNILPTGVTRPRTSPEGDVTIVDLTEVVLNGAYGWCGLCRSFTGFPHECSGADLPADDEERALT
jgi:hypothetical protein